MGVIDSVRLRASDLVYLEHYEICSAILDSSRNIMVLTADDQVFELPIGFIERLNTRLSEEMNSDLPLPNQDVR